MKRSMSPARRRRIWEAHHGRCEECGIALTVSEAELDHIIPLWMSDDDSDANFQILCKPHHADKTAKDARDRHHVKRIIARQDGTRRERREINSASFPNKNRKFDGSVGPVRARSTR